MREIPLTRGQVAIVDATDYDWLNEWKWHAQWSPLTKSFYACRSIFVGAERKKIGQQMHRLILGLERGDKRRGDHENLNTLDNRRLNLRIATANQNGMNRGIPRNNTSGYKGAHFNKGCGLWCAHIGVAGKVVHLGVFATPELAHEAYKSAAVQHYGEFARFD